MPSELQTYMQTADEAQRQITGSCRGRTGFLTTAARLYKYPYAEQVMIHARRPDAADAEKRFYDLTATAKAAESRMSEMQTLRLHIMNCSGTRRPPNGSARKNSDAKSRSHK